MQTAQQATEIEGFDPHWESAIYGAGRHLNLYPDSAVVSFVLGRFAKAADRTAIRILDVGCGAGNNVWFLAREGFAAAGIDGARTAVDFARSRLDQDGLNADLVTGDFQTLPWLDNRFDCVIDGGAIACNRRAVIERTLDEVRRVLRPGGLLLSMIYGIGHAGRLHGLPLGDGSFTDFSGGDFTGIPLIYFASVPDLDDLYASRFLIEGRNLEVVEDHHGKGDCTSATWHVTARKPAVE